MSSFCENRTHIPLTDNEKRMVINIHRYLSGDISITKQKQKFTLRKQVALVSGISESTVGAVLSDWNKWNDGTFSSNQKIRRPKLEPNEDIALLLRVHILESNKDGQKLSTPYLLQFLSENGYLLSKWQLLRLLHKLGYYYGQGERRNILYESPANVAFRYRYLRYRLLT